jgi:hypothetical protein
LVEGELREGRRGVFGGQPTEEYKRYRVQKQRFYHGVCLDAAKCRYHGSAIFSAIPIFLQDATGLAKA